ncbi:MAG: OB-fold nucleic acid binding domain-containing protein [Candidatus Thorarchaeota archaeon]
MKVHELSSASRRVDIRLRILSLEPVRDVQTRYGKARVTTAQAGDETGTIKLSLWNDDIDRIDEGTVVEVQNGFVKMYRDEMELSAGRYGEIVIIDDASFPSREEILSKHPGE